MVSYRRRRFIVDVKKSQQGTVVIAGINTEGVMLSRGILVVKQNKQPFGYVHSSRSLIE